MNSSDSKFIGDLTLLALVSPEYINNGSEYNEVPQDVSAEDYQSDMSTWRFMLNDAISRNDKEQISILRKDIQREKTRHKIVRRLISEQKSISEYAGI